MKRAGLALGALVATLAACGGGGPKVTDLAFVTTRDGDYAIYGMKAAGGGEHRLVAEKGDPETAQRLFFQIDPAWTHDGTRIAFASKREGPFRIFVMNADGTGTRRITRSKKDDVKPSFSPDDTRLVFSRGAPGDLYVVGLDGGEPERVTRTEIVDEAEPAWSPDGEWIVYARREPNVQVRELWLVRPDGSDNHRLTNLQGISGGPQWSPDSKQIVFSSNANDQNYELYTIGADGKNLRRLTSRAADDFEPSWSRDGTTIAFSREGVIYFTDLAGNEREVSSGKNDTSPAWRPVTPAPTGE